jgi:type II secretory pathway component GspD/PulD (secretin)
MKTAPIAALALAFLPLFQATGEDKPAPPETIKFIELKHLQADRLHRVINLVQQLTLGKAQIVSDDVLHTIALKGTSEGVAHAEQMLRRFDVPAAETKVRQIQLTVYLVEANADSSTGQPVPPELSSALQQLRTTFGYDKLRLRDTTVLQSRENAAFDSNGILPGTTVPPDQKVLYFASYKWANYNVVQEATYVSGFSYSLRIMAGGQVLDSGIKTDVTIKDGQKLVLGKLTRNEHPVFLILTTKVEP